MPEFGDGWQRAASAGCGDVESAARFAEATPQLATRATGIPALAREHPDCGLLPSTTQRPH
jgi:hypothetical protein